MQVIVLNIFAACESFNETAGQEKQMDIETFAARSLIDLEKQYRAWKEKTEGEGKFWLEPKNVKMQYGYNNGLHVLILLYDKSYPSSNR